MIAALVDRLRHGDRNALARLISIAARGEHLTEIQSHLATPLAGRASDGAPARVVAFTGSGGVGKSSLIGKLLPILRNENKNVAVLACDPESPLTGGALLGDRFRMGSPTDDGVFIRSLAALSGHGALADHLDVIIQLLETFGFDVILLETVGAGQGDVRVHDYADVIVLLLQPESGDDVQWEKAGILECADVIAVHKADLPAADQTAAQVRAALDLSPSRDVPLVRVSTKANQGHEELWRAIEAMPLRRKSASAAMLLFQMAHRQMEARFREAERNSDPELAKIVDAWKSGELKAESAVRELMRILASRAP